MTVAECRDRIVAWVGERGEVRASELHTYMGDHLLLSIAQGQSDLRVLVREGRLVRVNRYGVLYYAVWGAP